MRSTFFSTPDAVLQALHQLGDLVERVGVELVADQLQVGAGRGQFVLIANRGREDHRLGHLDGQPRFDADRLAVLLEVDVQPAFQFALRKHVVLREQRLDLRLTRSGRASTEVFRFSRPRLAAS